MKTVAILHPFLFRYARGIERYTVALAGALEREGVAVDILTWKHDPAISWPEAAGLNIRSMALPRYFSAEAAGFCYAGHFSRHRYDEVFVHFADYGEGLAFRLLELLRHRQSYSLVLHYPYAQATHRYHSFIGWGMHKKARSIIAVSRSVAEEAEKIFERKCFVIENGVDAGMFKPDAGIRLRVREELGISNRAPFFLTVAALEERKGIQHMIQAMPQILEKQPNAVFAVIGEGGYQETLERLACRFGVEHAVRFLEKRTPVAPYYQAADACVLLSKGEAFGLVLLEAMACGIPVIASRQPPFDGFVRSLWGRLVTESDPAAVAAAAGEIMADPLLRKQMGEAGRAEAETNYSWSRAARSYRELLDGLDSKERRR